MIMAHMQRREFCKLSAGGIAGAIGASTAGTAGAAEPSTTAVGHPGSLPVVTTRDHFDVTWSWNWFDDGFYEAELVDGHSRYDYGTDGSIPWGADELVVIVHGWSNDPSEAADMFERVSGFLEDAGYDGPTVGYSYDASVDFLKFWQVGKWWAHYEVAQRNGPKLASFIHDFADSGGTIRLVGHSLGAQPMCNALVTLDRVGTTVDSVSMLAGATEDASVSTDGAYGEHIERNADAFHNYYIDGDVVLDAAYAIAEVDQAAGEEGCDGPRPANYTDHDVSDLASNHFDYVQEGDVIDRAVSDW